jgi:hypothetical protein
MKTLKIKKSLKIPPVWCSFVVCGYFGEGDPPISVILTPRLQLGSKNR